MKYLVLKEFDDRKLMVLDDIKSKQEEFDSFYETNQHLQASVFEAFIGRKRKESPEGKVYCLDVRELGNEEDIASGKRAECLRTGNVFSSSEEAEEFLAQLFKRESKR